MQVIKCQWTIDVSVQAKQLNRAELRNGEFCCCDNGLCRDELADLPDCPADTSDCDPQVTLKLAGCNECPGMCCHVLNGGNSDSVNITNFTLQVPEMLVKKVSE